ncbi:MAG: non-ribosomal peptide synthetase [Roseinatronobacter sp.]
MGRHGQSDSFLKTPKRSRARVLASSSVEPAQTAKPSWNRSVPHLRTIAADQLGLHLQPIPLTAAQAGLVAESLNAVGAGFNIEQVVLRFDKRAPSPDELARAFAFSIARHDCLRLTIRLDQDAQLVQECAPEIAVPITSVDWTDAMDPEQQVQAWLANDRAQGFSFDGSPLWRVLHARTGGDRAILVWTLHHAITDLGSMAQILNEVGQWLDDSVPTPKLVPSIQGLADWTQGQDQCKARDYFGTHLQGFDGPTLPNLRQKSVRSQDRGVCRAQLGADLRAALDARAKRSAATLLNLIQLAFGLALSRWSAADRATIGLTHGAWAAWPPARDMTGCRLATLPFHQFLPGDKTLGAHLAHLRAATREQRAFLGTPAATLRAAAGAEGGAPLFEAVLSVVPKALPTLLTAPRWKGARVNVLEKGAAALTLGVYLEPDLDLVLEHDTALLPRAHATSFLSHIAQLLRAMVGASDGTPLGALDMLPQAESARILFRAAPERPVPARAACPATRFAEQAAQTPTAPALTCAETGITLTYGQLAARMRAVAAWLRAQGQGVGSVIAIDLPRGPDFVVALFGIWTAGAIALPLDPVLPAAQKNALRVQAKARYVIGAEGLDVSRLPTEALVSLLPHDAERPAYLIFTSGSTGHPKGVLGSCGALSAHADAIIAAYSLRAQDRCLGFAGLGFDVALEEIVPTLLVGAHLVLRSEAAAQSLPAFHALVAKQALTVLNLPASFWHVLVDDLAERGVGLSPSVRLLVTGSERIRPDALARFRALAPNCAFVNGYGPTEATITSTAFVLPAGASAPDPAQDVPIGRPLGHARAYIRALDGTLAPDGVEGELWIGGPAVTLGYLDQPDLTAQVFQPDPFQPGGRVYNTGDRALWRADGTLDYLGRRDRQVKLRGQRLDLNGIERVLADLPGIAQVHVALDSAGSAKARLLAWLVPAAGSAIGLQACQAAMEKRLQPAARPVLMLVDRLPLTPNGKIATALLPRPQMAKAAPAAQGDALALQLAGLMAQVLDQDHIDPDQDFHDLGGDSLSAVRLAMLAERALGRPVAAMDIHRNPSPAALAQALRSTQPRSSLIVPIQPHGTQPAFFAVHVLGPRESQWRPLAQALGPDWPVYGISVGAPRSLDEIDIPSIAEVYFREIQTHYPDGPLMLGATSMASYYAYDLAQRLIAAGRDVRLVVAFDAAGPGGRPALRRWGKVAAHLRQLARRGLGHVRAVRQSRALMRKIEADLAQSDEGEVTGINIVQATIAAVDRYQPAPISAPLLVLRADTSFWDTPEALATCLGWAQVAHGGVRMVDVPGEHLTILDPGNVETLAERLSQVVRDKAPS